MRRLATIAAGAGIVLLVLSYVWPSVSDGSGTWLPTDAERLQELERELHQLHYKLKAAERAQSVYAKEPVDGATLVEDRERFQQLEQEATSLKQKLTAARDSPNRVATLLRWSGVALAILGTLGVLATSQRPA